MSHSDATVHDDGDEIGDGVSALCVCVDWADGDGSGNLIGGRLTFGSDMFSRKQMKVLGRRKTVSF